MGGGRGSCFGAIRGEHTLKHIRISIIFGYLIMLLRAESLRGGASIALLLDALSERGTGLFS